MFATTNAILLAQLNLSQVEFWFNAGAGNSKAEAYGLHANLVCPREVPMFCILGGGHGPLWLP